MASYSESAARPLSPRDNAILASLPEDEYGLLAEHFEVADYELRTLLHQANVPLEFVYFPLDALTSLVTEVEQDTHVEVGAIGSEGMLGIPIFLGARSSPHSAYCQVPGQMVRLRIEAFHDLLPDTPALARRLSRFSNILMAQLGQNAACNRAHSAEQRCARWVLLTADRIGRDAFDITHEFLAEMIGVRRATVSETTKALSEAGLIRSRRGVVAILDRQGLAQRACPCYEQLRSQIEQLSG